MIHHYAIILCPCVFRSKSVWEQEVTAAVSIFVFIEYKKTNSTKKQTTIHIILYIYIYFLVSLAIQQRPSDTRVHIDDLQFLSVARQRSIKKIGERKKRNETRTTTKSHQRQQVLGIIIFIIVQMSTTIASREDITRVRSNHLMACARLANWLL